MAKLSELEQEELVKLCESVARAHAKVAPKKRIKRRGFTDRMYRYNVAFVTVVTVSSFALMFLSAFLPALMPNAMQSTLDLSPLSVIVPAAFGELALHTGFVVWKAKAENMRKYPQAVDELKEMEYKQNET